MILYVDDNETITEYIQSGFRNEGWILMNARSGGEAIDLLKEYDFKLILMDRMLPDMDGIDLCRYIRNSRNPVPIMFLSVLNETYQMIECLKAGADDYLLKPFIYDELVARVECLLRFPRESCDCQNKQSCYQCGTLLFDPETMRVFSDGEEIKLTSKERNILHCLLERRGKIFSREKLLAVVWNQNYDPMTNVVDVYVGRLRKKLGRNGKLITTVRGAGYRLDA